MPFIFFQKAKILSFKPGFYNTTQELKPLLCIKLIHQTKSESKIYVGICELSLKINILL